MYENLIDKELYKYLNSEILPKYNHNIGGHDISHIEYVINRCFELIDEFKLDVNYNMIYTIAMFHDIGYMSDPENHEQVSADMFLKDEFINEFFNSDEINTMYEAIIDHRASLEYEARSLYGKIVSSADRETSVENMLIRSLKYQKDKHHAENPTLEDIIDYSYSKLNSKYSKNDGYAKMYFKDKKYLKFVDNINLLLENKELFTIKEKELASKINLF